MNLYKKSHMLIALINIIKISLVPAYRNRTTNDQLVDFALHHPKPLLMTTSSGYPLTLDDTQTINSRLMLNDFFMEYLSHLPRDRIQERVVHSKGAGAFGYFRVTHDLSDICKAKVFDTVGKTTPLVARFSPSIQRAGGTDFARETRGFAIKMHTEEGNLDFVNLNVEMFQIKDPVIFPTFVHSFNKNPVTNVQDPNAIWDYMTLRPETLQMFIQLFSDRGIPDGYRHMPGWAIHTFELINRYGNRTYARFQFQPDAGIINLTTEQAQRIQAEDLDYFIRDLYNAIASGDYPSWTMYVQTVSKEDLSKVDFDIFDVTKRWPVKDFPLREIGKIVLNKNPVNYFADVEQAAYNAGHLVPGIRGVDTLFEARVFNYRDAQIYRLGVNFNKIKVNCPLSPVNTFYRDGKPPVLDNEDGAPNYYPNSFNGPQPYSMIKPERITVYTDPRPNNFDQASDLYEEMDEDERCRLAENIVALLRDAKKFIQVRAIKLFTLIHKELAKRVEHRLKIKSKGSVCPSL